MCLTINAFAQTHGSKERPVGPNIFDINGGKSSCCAAEPDGKSFSPFNSAEYETYRLTATYYSLRDNLTTTLMLNNKGPQPILATPTIYSLSGTRLQLAPITVGATSYLDVDMHELLSGTADEFREGSMKIAYNGISQQLGAQVKMVEAENNLIWAEQFVYASKFTSSRLETLWWLPYQNSETKVVVSNTSSGTVTATLTVDGTSPHQSEPLEITFAPWETRVLDILSDIAGRQNGHVHDKGGISITHSGAPGAVLARMFIAKPNKGYSAAVNFVDPEATASQRWHGNGFRFRNVNGAKLEPVLTARNTGDQLSRVSGRIIYTLPNGDTSTIYVPEKQIAANTTKVFSLENLIDNANVPNAIKYGGIELEYDTPKGTILTSVQSISQNGDHVFQVPMFDPQNMPSSAGGFPWKADGDFTTIVYIKNETDLSRKYTTHLVYEGGGYSLGIKEIKAGETVAVDFRELRDSQTPDGKGNIIPLNVEKGQIAWSVRGAENKVLSGRSEQISIAGGMASTYACYNCCPNNHDSGWIDPVILNDVVDGNNVLVANETEINCYSQVYGPYLPFPISWDSSDPDVATIDSSGNTTAVGGGDATIYASWEGALWYQSPTGVCDAFPNPITKEALMDVLDPDRRIISITQTIIDESSQGGEVVECGRFKIKVKYAVGCPPPAHTIELIGNIAIDADLLSQTSPQLISNQNNESCTYETEFSYRMKNRLQQSVGSASTSYKAKLTWNSRSATKSGEGISVRATISGVGPCP